MLLVNLDSLGGLRPLEGVTPLLFLALYSLPVVYLVFNEVVRRRARIRGLKGPAGLPVIGNIWQIRKNASERYRQWVWQHGAVYQVQLGNVPVVLVNTATAAKKIFGSNSQALASRPQFYTFHKLVSDTAGTTIGTSPYSDSLKRRRKGAASALNRPSVGTYVAHLDVETRDFVKELYVYGGGGKMPIDPMPMIQRLSLSLALTLNWGMRVASQDENIFHEITHVEEEISRFRSTTANLQDYIPLLRLLPFNRHSAKGLIGWLVNPWLDPCWRLLQPPLEPHQWRIGTSLPRHACKS